MIRELWTYISNLGISDKISSFDQKAIKLMNQISFVMMIWFGIMAFSVIFSKDKFDLYISFINLVLFAGVLVINAYRYTTVSKNYFMIWGLGMVTFVNLSFDPAIFPMAQFIITAVFPVLIFRKTRSSLIYLVISFLLLSFVLYYHRYYSPLFPGGVRYHFISPYISIGIIMIVAYLISLFFRNVGDDLERKLTEKNRYLNDLVNKMQSLQDRMVRSEKMASLGQLTAGIAHEINNPINFVSSNINPLKLDLNELKDLCNSYKTLHGSTDLQNDLKKIERLTEEMDTEFLYSEIETLISGIEEGAGRTKQIVLGLRNFSRIDEEGFKEIDIHENLDSTLLLLRNKLKNRIEVVKDYGNIPFIECIPGKFNQVLMNILNNAGDAILDKGTIRIKTNLSQDKEKVKIQITDDGMGMTEAVRRRIFEPFFTTKEIGQGTGLGLSITFGIIEDHGGSINVNSTPGKGSEFIITLPVKQPDKQN